MYQINRYSEPTHQVIHTLTQSCKEFFICYIHKRCYSIFLSRKIIFSYIVVLFFINNNLKSIARATNIHLLTKQNTDILLYNLHLRYQYSSWFISCHSNLGPLPKLCIAVYIFKSHVKRAIVIWTHNYIPIKTTVVTSKCVTKSAQIFDGKTSKSDAIVLNSSF